MAWERAWQLDCKRTATSEARPRTSNAVGVLHQEWVVSGGSIVSHMLLTRIGNCIT